MYTLNSNRITNGKTEGNTANHLINESSNCSIKNQSPEGNKSIDQSINQSYGLRGAEERQLKMKRPDSN